MGIASSMWGCEGLRSDVWMRAVRTPGMQWVLGKWWLSLLFVLGLGVVWGGRGFRKRLPTSFFPFRLLSSYNPGIPESPVGGEGSANLNSTAAGIPGSVQALASSRPCGPPDHSPAAVLTGEYSVCWGNALALESFGLAPSSAISGCVISGSSPHFSQPRSPRL